MPRPIDWTRFDHPEQARSSHDRVAPRLGSKLAGPLAALLAQSPDAGGVLHLLERYVNAASPEVLREIARRPGALTYLAAAFAFGGSMAEPFLSEPALAVQFARDRTFMTPRSRDDLSEEYARLAATQSSPDVARSLAHFKRRQYVRIALKDVLGFATLAETTLELSALADVILTQALLHAERELQKRFGPPQYRDAQGRVAPSGFSIISLGKLGGSELNYSSDIDLLYLYARDGETAGLGTPDSAVSNKEYFVRLAQAITQQLTEVTVAGPVFRVDLRLRPEGDQGDLTLALDAALDYYGHRARDWELQMLIKARHSAGDPRLTRAFLRGVQPFVYSSPTDPDAVASVMLSRARITQHLREGRSEALDVKLHPGGIRDVEFLTQCLQRLYGAREAWVRSGGTLHALRKLNDKELLSDSDYAALTSAYEFLRRVEHRIQLDQGRQSHRVPRDPAALDLLARRVGEEAGVVAAPGAALTERLREVMSQVKEIAARLIPALGAERAPAAAFELRPPLPGAELHRHSPASLLRLLEARAPEAARLIRDAALPPRARPRLGRFVAAVLASPNALTAAREQPAALERALEAVRVSEHLAAELARQAPDLAEISAAARPARAGFQMDMRLEPEDASPPAEGAAGQCRGGRPALPFAWAAEEGLCLQDALSLLRRSYHARALGLGVNDCAVLDDVFAALGRWSDLAATAVASAFAIAGRFHAPRPGEPSLYPTLAVLALGRLGLAEFDLGSDVDLLFVAPSGTPPESTAYGTRLAEKTIEGLASYTKEGVVFAVDTRLRPRGVEGELVVTEEALFDYVVTAAQPWEALTYLKMCPVAGNAEAGMRASAGVAERVFQRFADDRALAPALSEMRRRLEKEVKGKAAPTKTSAGGYYDVDFALSYLRIRHRLHAPAGSNMRDQIGALAAAGALPEADSRGLLAGAGFLRAFEHAVRLVTGRASRGWHDRPGQAEGVAHLLRHWRLLGLHSLPLKHLESVQEQIREIYRRILGPE
jgi:glutamate-ammonia-ligase adenylyltransferase